MKTARKALFLIVASLVVLLLAASVAMAGTPKRVMIVVMDQMRPEYAKQFDMTNVLRLQKHGVSFPNAYVGDMASETVVSHNVMVSGLFPKHMGWSDEAIRDVDNVLGYGAGAIVTVGDLGTADYVKLITAAGNYPKLGDYLRGAFPGTVVCNVGQKGYQVESMAAESSDWWVRMGSKKKTADLPDPSVVPWSGTYRGAGGNPPAYIKSDPRYMVSVGNAWDKYGTDLQTPSWLYPEDGRYVPGNFPGHESGDAWVADAALAMMEHENWSGMFITFSAMDKIGHMWGAGSVDGNADPLDWVHLPFVAKNADDQLGRVIAKLKELDQFDDTLIILTADHGGEAATRGYYGHDVLDGGNLSWYAGAWFPQYDTTKPPTEPNTTPGPDALQPLFATGNVDFSYQSTAIEAWLKDASWCKKAEAAKILAKAPGVIATYVKSADNDRYCLRSAAPWKMNGSEFTWWSRHGQELVNTMASKGSADVVALLRDRVGYGVFGDHGGAQKQVQKIPMIVSNPSIARSCNASGMRLVDITPTVLKAMGIPLKAPVDGRAYRLPFCAN